MLIRKTRLRLTLFGGGITTLILVVMTLGYLYISEKNLMTTKLLSCQSDIYTIASNLEQQSVISHTWLSKLEGNGSYYISLLDNGVPFLFDSKKHGANSQDVINAVWDYYHGHAADMDKDMITYRSFYVGFPYHSGQEYYCFVVTIKKEKTNLEMLLILPLSVIKEQIFRQRMNFLCIILLALCCIWLFSWFFTGKLLQPIEESRRKQNQFLASASHELRTPLAVILSCTESLLAKAPTRDLSTIKNEALRMSRLLEDMLTLSSSDSGYLAVKPAETELDTLLLDAYESFEPMAKEHRIHLTIAIPDSPLPACTCDRERIAQVLAILLHNAISYTPENGSVSMTLTYEKDCFSIKISDTGVGIPDEEKDKIFDRFYRSEKSRSAKGHFGLGLSIACEIIAAHHGTLTVRDAAGGGAVFSIRLP